MMASNLLSRILPSADDESIYEPLHGYERRRRTPDVEDHAGTAVDEANLEAQFFDNDIDHLIADAVDSQITTESTAYLDNKSGGRAAQPAAPLPKGPKWMRKVPAQATVADEDDDVPESLLLGNERPVAAMNPRDSSRRQSRSTTEPLPPPVPGPSTRTARAQWNATWTQQRLHDEDYRENSRRSQLQAPRGNGAIFVDPKEEAMWRWVNVQNLDRFLSDVYAYFEGRGIWSILLTEALELLRLAFLVGLIFLLTSCIQYNQLFHAKSLADVMVPKCTQSVHGFKLFVLWLFLVYWAFRAIQLIGRIRQLYQLHNFYHHLLDIPDSDIQTVSWQLVVSRLMALRDSNLATAENVSARDRRNAGAHSKERMDAHDIANRIMRKENYLIALFNKDILNLTVPLPFIGDRQFYSRTMEVLLKLCLMDFVFTPEGQIHPKILQSKNRRNLIDLLNRRFKGFALLSLVLVPFYALYFVVAYFLRYFSEYKSDPSQIGSRMFTPLAEWKFREFNELRHLFKRRRNRAYPFANCYLQQFPKYKTDKFCNFIIFVVGSMITLLGFASLLYPEMLVELELTPGKTVMFWLGVLTVIWSGARNTVTTQDPVYDPEDVLKAVIDCTHYCPATWRDRLHTDDVRKDFTTLYQLRIVVFLEEILSMVIAPFVLYHSLPKCSARIVDFFREFTVHVDGLGHVCSFAVFDFKKTADNIAQAEQDHDADHRDYHREYYATKDGKLHQSMMGFMQEYGANPNSRGHFNLPPAFPPLAGSVMGINPGVIATARNPPAQQNQQMQSILLDPHHQPAMRASHLSPYQAAQVRLRSNRHPLSSQDEAGEGPSHIGAVENESHLDESWLPGGDDDDDESDTGDGRPAHLTLLHQLKTIHAQGRGPSV